MNARNIITTIVNKIPGIRYKELQRVANMPNGTLSYHIDMLTKNGVIKVRRDAGSTRLFPLTIDDNTAEIISLLKDDVRLKIVKHLLKCSSTYQELHNIVDRSCSTLTWHLDKLIASNVVCVRNVIGMNEYYIRDQELIKEIINKHLIVANFIDLWNEL